MCLKHRVSSTVLLTCLACAGCSLWSEPVSAPTKLPTARMSPDSVVIQVALVQISADSDRIDEETWQEIDEQLLPPEVRRRLARNGFRCGLIGDQIPNAIRELLDQQQAESTLAGPSPKLPQHRIHCGAGHRNEIVASGRREEVVVLHHTQGSLRGTTYRDARCVLATRCFPAGDGGARIEITPEIDHGPVRQKWVPGDGMFRLEAGHERHSFTELTMDTKLVPGQSLILTCTPERVGVGRNFFVEDQDGKVQQKLVLIRLAQSQTDDLFFPVAKPPPVTAVY